MFYSSVFVFVGTMVGIATGNLFQKLNLPTSKSFKFLKSNVVSGISECCLMCKEEVVCSVVRFAESSLQCGLFAESVTNGTRIIVQDTSEYWIKSKEKCIIKEEDPLLPKQAECRPCFSTTAAKYDCLNIQCNKYPYYQGCPADRKFFVHTGGPGTKQYARMKINQKPFTSIAAVTLCYWVLEYKEHGVAVSAVHYGQRSDNGCNDFALTYGFDANLGHHTLQLHVLQAVRNTRGRTNDHKIHHVCISWSNVGGDWKFYLDGELFSAGTGFQRNKRIRTNGRLIVAQNVDRRKSGKNWHCDKHLESNNLFGDVSGVYFWHKVLTGSEIKELYRWCKIPQSDFLLSEWATGNVTLYSGAVKKSYCL